MRGDALENSRERERDKERKRRTDYILHRAAPKAPTVLAPGAGQLMGRVKKRRVEYV
jgi:phage terminase small subunit